ncbi:enoyl-CoA hydratase/carnithine racemase [Prauserella isguenensis]|uniref:Enoyl-CoA hydratase/carnithine racemase n=1 Tax=Prauserella isguenensis TaxID=1470180 RepID=A0A839S307_9PSEU|nr:enoyl-CoA hydratase/isomerase family protein [Prauserella isguenensis]MBB3051440.1 enoyl-CoA hydratase/carnithine racemase [Prauserella isguenensis]
MAVELTRFERTEPRPGVVVLTMSWPAKLNAMDQSWFRQLRDVMDTFGHGDEDHVRAVVLTGSGRAFSAGGDIDMFAGLDGDVARVRPHLRLVYDAFHAVERCAVPVIAAVNGVAYGGGTELALASDVVLAGESARFAFKEPTVGLMPGFGIVRGPDVIGRHWTRYLALSGRDVDAATAERIGLVQEVHPDGELCDRAVELACDMAAHPPLAVRVGKAFVNRDTAGGFAESVEATALLFDTDDHRAAVRTFRATRGR